MRLATNRNHSRIERSSRPNQENSGDCVNAQDDARMETSMAKHDEYIIEPRDNGGWAVLKPHAEHASALTDTKTEAIKWAKKHAPEGDIKVNGNKGKFEYL